MSYKHIFFDLDRTLWDFDKNSQNAIQDIFDHHKVEERNVVFDDFLRRYRIINEACWALYRVGKMPKEKLRTTRFEQTFQHFGIDDIDLATDFGLKYLEISPRKTHLVDGSVEVLDYLKTKGYELHIITNGFLEVQDIKIDNCGLRDFFDVVVISEQLEHKKPHPSVFNHSLERSGANASQSIMIGDDLAVDIVGARNAGIDQVYFNPSRDTHDEKVTFEIDKLIEIREIL